MITRNELKFIKALQQKKNRVAEGLFLVEGLKNVNELLKSSYQIDKILVSSRYKDKIDHAKAIEVKEKDLDYVSSLKSNSSCVAVVRKPHPSALDFSKHIVVLDGVSDPGNLGTIIRTMDWFGFSQLVCSDDSAEFYNPKTIASTMGSFTRIIPLYLPLDDFFKQNTNPTYGMLLDGQTISGLDTKSPSVFVMGSESHGIRKEFISRIDHPITIPGNGKAESLNVAIATAILLHHLSS
jgi:TrmH family RNA methyltransferase